MANYDISANVNISKERLQDVIEKAVIVDQPLLREVMKGNAAKMKKLTFSDNKWIIPITVKYPASAGGRAEGTTLPGGTVGTRIRMTAAHKKHVARSYLTWEQHSLGDKSAYIKAIPQLVSEDLIRGFKDTMNMSLHGYIGGTDQDTGCIGVVYTGIATNTVTCNVHGHATYNKQHAPGVNWIRVGKPIKATEADGTHRGYGVVESVDRANHQFNFVAGHSLGALAATDLLFEGDANGNSKGNVLTGLYYHGNDDSVTTYQGQTRSSYPEIYANVLGNSGTSRALSPLLVWQAMDKPLEYSYANVKYNFLMMSTGLRRAWADLFDDKVRLSDGAGPRGVDHTKSKLAGLNLVPVIDPYINPGRIYFIDTSCLCLAHANKLFEFENWGTGNLFSFVGSNADSDIYECRNRCYCQLISDNPRYISVIEDLTDDSLLNG